MLPFRCKSSRSDFRCAWRHLIAAIAATLVSMLAFAQTDAPRKTAPPPLGVQIVLDGDEPELRVDGVPFFINAAQFDYFRIPPDLWIGSLTRYRDLGINTIDLRIPWNWHEISDGVFDFEGHTNPRRNLRALLRQITQMGLKVIVHPGPSIGDNWRNGGYPPWLLGNSDYKMIPTDIQRGIVPQDANLAAGDANAAAGTLLKNEIHMSYARRWLTTVAREIAPYSAKHSISVPEIGAHEGETTEKQMPGPILLVALDDAVAMRSSAEAPDLARYLSELRGAIARGGLDAISFVNVSSAADRGVTPFAGPEGVDVPSSIAFAGQWFFQPPAALATARPVSLKDVPGPSGPLLTTANAASLIFLAHSLGSQTHFPPFLSAFATTTFAPGNDSHAVQSAPENTLLAARLFLGSGIRAMVYAPLQDTLTPAGWATPLADRYYRWDAALDLAGNRGPRANGVSRNGQFISAWGAMLAASHVHADFGIVDLRASGGAADESTISQGAREMEQLFRVAVLAGYAPELVNPGDESVERLLRNRAILLPVADSKTNVLLLSVKAQAALVEFVKRGGTLIYFPERPQGALLEPLLQGAPANSPAAGTFSAWTFERGRVIEAANNIHSWVSLDEELSQNRAQPKSSGAIMLLSTLLEGAGVHRTLLRSPSGEPNSNLITSQIVPNTSSGPADEAQACAEKQLCAASLVSVTNLSPDRVADESFEIIDPRQYVGKPAPPKISLAVTVPARESLMLPVHASLCSAISSGEHCSDEVVAAGAELLGAEREGKTLELSFYAPARAVVRLRLESEPSKVELEEDLRLDAEWKQETSELEVRMLRGAAPDYRRILRVHLRYTPHVTEKPDPDKIGSHSIEYQVFDGIRFPLALDVTIPSGPPLIVADPNLGGHMVIVSHNHSDEVRVAEFTLDGAFHGSASARMFGDEELFTRVRFQPLRTPAVNDAPIQPRPDGLFRGTLSIKSGHEHGTFPVLYVTADEAGNSHYQYDFDRDGSPEWTLESSRLRLIVSPADSGRALALVDKTTNDNLITLGGALHDFLIPADREPRDAWESGDFAFNRGYRPEWIEGKQSTSLRLTYQEYVNSSAGIHVDKTLRFPTPETVEAAYRIFLVTPSSDASESTPEAKENFISMLSIPLPVGEDRNTHVCWQMALPAAPPIQPPVAKAASEIHCEDVVSDGAPISVPAGVARMEVTSPGLPPLAMEWNSGQAMIVPRTFSAEMSVFVPVPRSSDAPGEFTLRYTVGNGP
jgi:hypothetical protein